MYHHQHRLLTQRRIPTWSSSSSSFLVARRPMAALFSSCLLNLNSNSNGRKTRLRNLKLNLKSGIELKDEVKEGCVVFDLGDGEKKLLLDRWLKEDQVGDKIEAKRESGGSVSGTGGAEGPGSSNSNTNDNNNNNNDGKNSNNGIQKVSVPKEYPQTLAIPLTRRPLFPGFYKSLYIKDQHVIAAIQALLDRRQPYVSIFLTKDERYEPDTLVSADQVHPVGVFAQITSVYNAGPDDKALTVVVYPHRRVHLDSLLPLPVMADARANPEIIVESVKEGDETSKTQESGKAANVSTDKEPSLASASSGRTFSGISTSAVVEDLAEEGDLSNPGSDISIHIDLTMSIDSISRFLKLAYTAINQHLASHAVSVTNISNKPDSDYSPESPTIKATISEILNVLKEISLMNPLLRDQILTFSIQTGGNAFAALC
ncbi:UNVERIFIED_CONTAM: ATP-dependent Lon protease pim1 [Siphonaria sp. JEL0065]|nr:ATP-dependent Lon protease pim1 [Siphonaria sp. JEL0065]